MSVPELDPIEDGLEPQGPDRRGFLRDAGALGLGAIALGVAGGEATARAIAATVGGTRTADATPSCTLTPEVTEGPYYVSLERVRRKITEDRGGVPLRLRITVVDSRTCTPIRGAAVDVWHCDALGVYSDVQGNTDTFLRGVQLTDASGRALFDTIYPGWYQGRATHIHLKVHIGGRASGARYSGGHVAHTGQLFFPESLTDRVIRLSPYRRHTGTRTRNGEDSIYAGAGGSSAILRLTRVSRSSLARGLIGAITLGVDPTATPSAVGGGGPGGPPA
jgi:protocatechuate 3,4-dioxygenase beta subunit